MSDRLDWMLQTYSSPEAFVRLMDEASIDYAVILAELASITSGIAANEDMTQLCSHSPHLNHLADELEELVRNRVSRA